MINADHERAGRKGAANITADAFEPSEESLLEVPLERRVSLIKWLIFGVVLPSLPFAARALAAWVDDNPSSLSFNTLLSDGELLVVATVIAAAVIGDLLFDFSGGNDARTQAGKALLCTIALVAVIASVLMFGLVTLNNQHRNDSFHQAQEKVTAFSNDSTTLQRQSANLKAQSNADLNEFLTLSAQAQDIREETRKISTHSSQYKILAEEAGNLEQQARFTKTKASQESQASASLNNLANQQQKTAEESFTTSLGDLDNGEKQASYMSVLMFTTSFIIGLLAYAFPKSRSPAKRNPSQQEIARAADDTEEGRIPLDDHRVP